MLTTVDAEIAGHTRAALARDDDYATVGKPPCDWDDPSARDALVDALVRDALSARGVINGASLGPSARRRPSCWPWSRAKTWPKAATGSFASCAAWPATR